VVFRYNPYQEVDLLQIYALTLGSWPAAFPQSNLGSGSDALTVKQLSTLGSSARLIARCMTMHFMPRI